MGDKKSTDHPSLHPPRHGYYKDDDDASASSPEDKHTSWVLLDLKAYIADRENSTTACAVMTSDGETIQVTFCAAPTPLVSYICVWCPGLRTADMLAMRPSIEAVESDLLLLRVTVSTYKANYFIYKANGGRNGGPSLRPIQIPRPCLDLPYSIALLGHRDLLLPSDGEEDDDDAAGHYYLAGLSFDSYSRTDSTIHYSFWLFDSKAAGKWSKSPVSLHGDVPFHVTTKAIVLRQDGLVGFVDLLRGIIICDVLCHDKPRYLPLPLEAIRREDFYSEPTLFRDVAVVGGRLTLVELRYIIRPGTNLSCCWTWEVSTWSRKVTPDWEQDDDWRPDYRIQSGDIEVYEGTENVASLAAA
ncbi:unnamed protein product [Urochloa humidicola]